MPPLVCPRCSHTNPEIAVFCYYDGAELVPAHGKGQQVFGQLAREFVFPAGRRCATFDEFARGCQDEWPVARDLLRQGAFLQFFATTGRLDLARAAEEAMAQADADIGLTTFLSSLPVSPGQGPRLDFHPRRLILGNLLAGEARDLQLTISNQGQGVLQGTLSVVEGGDWLRLTSGESNGQCALRTDGDQKIALRVDTRGFAAAKTYGAKLRVVTNGGIVEVPAGLNLIAQPFPRAPLQGVRTPREIAVKMRSQPKAAVPLLESGEVARWFSVNGWDYPVRGTPARGVAGVQQFFESMGLSKPPVVRMSTPEVRIVCKYPEVARGQVFLQTSAKKWVYAQVESDAAWIRVLNPAVAGPQQAAIGLAVDPRLVPGQRSGTGTIRLTANAGQTLTVQVRAEVHGAPGPPGGRLLQPVLVMALTLLLLRLVVAPLVDLHARGAALASARAASPALVPDTSVGAWLQLPWARIFLGNRKVAAEDRPGAAPARGPTDLRDFREQFVNSFVRTVALWTWWAGAAAGLLVLRRRGGTLSDLPWGLTAGAVAGLAAGASLACLVLLGDLLPCLLWGLAAGGLATGAGGLILWILLALVCWTLVGALLGLMLGLLGPAGLVILAPLRAGLGGLCGLCGLRSAAAYFAMA